MTLPLVHRDRATADEASPARVTVTFASDSGRAYLYDDVTGAILPWNGAREAALQDLLGAASPSRPAARSNAAPDRHETSPAAVRFVRHWIESYGAFSRRPRAYTTPSDDEVIDVVRHSSTQLVLIITEQCNLRCEYCVYSGSYAFQRGHANRRMSLDTALRAVDWFAGLVAPQRAQQPGRKFALTFYGGEPLLNMPVIRGALEHAERQYPGLFMAGLTTNGTLLTPARTSVLAKHDVKVAVSIDGPPAEHDRNRRSADGHGTHAHVLENLDRIRTSSPDYWRQITALSVYDYATDLEAAAAFFHDNKDRVPPPAFVNMASDRYTTHWNGASDAQLLALRTALGGMRQRYKRAQIRGERLGTYERMLGGFDVFQLTIRQRVSDQRAACLPFSGTCFPGRKIAVRVDGAIDVCERVNGTRPIGHVDDGGLDPARIRGLVEDYQRTVLSRCHACPVTRLCGICFGHVLGDGDFDDPAALCAGVRERAPGNLRDYLSIMEANPKADFSFESDTAQMEKRWMFCS